MNVLEIIFGSVIILVSVIVILLVAAQEAKQANLSAIQGAGGGGGEFKGRGKSKDLLKKATKVFSAVFFVLVLASAIFTNVSK